MALALADNLLLALWLIHYSLRYVLWWLIHYSLRYVLRFPGATDPPVLIYVRVHTFPVLFIAQTWTIWLTVVSGPCNSFYCLGSCKTVYDDDDDFRLVTESVNKQE